MKEKEKIREKIYAGVNPVVLQPASDQHVLLHDSLLPTNILLINYIMTLIIERLPIVGLTLNAVHTGNS